MNAHKFNEPYRTISPIFSLFYLELQCRYGWCAVSNAHAQRYQSPTIRNSKRQKRMLRARNTHSCGVPYH